MSDQLAANEATITVFECTGCGRRWVDAPGEHGRWLCRGTVHERTLMADPMTRLLADRDGITHVALQPNTDDAWWTPILCGGGINLPGPQKRGNPSCPDCQLRLATRIGGDDAG